MRQTLVKITPDLVIERPWRARWLQRPWRPWVKRVTWGNKPLPPPGTLLLSGNRLICRPDEYDDLVKNIKELKLSIDIGE